MSEGDREKQGETQDKPCAAWQRLAVASATCHQSMLCSPVFTLVSFGLSMDMQMMAQIHVLSVVFESPVCFSFFAFFGRTKTQPVFFFQKMKRPNQN